jgi:hypothetical protein
MASGNFNMEDPSKQEQIRRGHHEYIPTAGKHGAYVPRQYDRSKNDYPKMMGKFPAPKLADFKGQANPEQLLENAQREWNRAMDATIVNSKAEEHEWLKANG